MKHLLKWFTVFILFVCVNNLLPTNAFASEQANYKALSDIQLIQEPAADSKVLATIKKGTVFTYYSDDLKYARVLYQGIKGYVKLGAIQRAASTVKIVSAKAGAVMYATPSVKAKVYTTVPKNDIVEHFQKVDQQWAFVEGNGYSGYVLANTLNEPKTITKYNKHKSTVFAKRSEKSTIRGAITVNSKITVYATYGTMAYAEADGLRGYILTKDLVNKKPYAYVIFNHSSTLFKPINFAGGVVPLEMTTKKIAQAPYIMNDGMARVNFDSYGFKGSKKEGYHTLTFKNTDTNQTVTLHETEKGFTLTDIDGEVIIVDYPMNIGQKKSYFTRVAKPNGETVTKQYTTTVKSMYRKAEFSSSVSFSIEMDGNTLIDQEINPNSIVFDNSIWIEVKGEGIDKKYMIELNKGMIMVSQNQVQQ